MHFHVHNGARDVETRNTRAQRPTHGGLKQHIMNGSRRLLRGRPVVITEEQLKQHISEFRAKAKEGILYVTTLDGREVNLYDDRLPIEDAPPPVNFRPNPPLDDANNDTPHGVPMGKFPGDAPPPVNFQMPVDPPNAAVENNPAATPPVPSEEPPAITAEVPAADLSVVETPAEGVTQVENPVEPVVEVLPETQPEGLPSVDEAVEGQEDAPPPVQEVPEATELTESDDKSSAKGSSKKSGKKGK